ncbi:MAG: hypothetical protein ABSG54_19755 [Terriglobia bacterium]
MKWPIVHRKSRAPCPVCHQGFRAATDAEWVWRWKFHQLSERHKKYVALQQEKQVTD